MPKGHSLTRPISQTILVSSAYFSAHGRAMEAEKKKFFFSSHARAVVCLASREPRKMQVERSSRTIFSRPILQ